MDSGKIDVEDIMVLVGPNQSGKSSILKGLSSISFTYTYDQQNELTQLNNINKKFVDGDLEARDLPIVTAYFTLEEEDKQALRQKFSQSNTEVQEGENIETGPEPEIEFISSAGEMEITKFIDGSYSVKIGGKTFSFPNPMQLVKEARDIIIDLKNDVKPDFERDPNRPHKGTLDSVQRQFLKILPEEGYVMPAKQDVITPLKDLQNNPLDQQLKDKIKAAMDDLEELYENYPADYDPRIFSFLLERMPRTVYFKDYERVEDSLTLQELETNPEEHTAFINMLQLAEVKVDSLEKQKDSPTAIQQYLQNASGIVTKKLRDVWGQESFELQLRYADERLMVFTADPQEPGTLLPPSYGSEGFQWFLGFYINFAVATKTEYKNAILLLDDPGVLLHPSGHKDLLKRFKEYLQDEVRTIYSTHVPSLIPKDSINSIRVLYKENGKTNVVKNFWKLDNKDAWAPVRASLGIDLTDSFFLGNQTVMVEGPSDAVYLQGFLEMLRMNNRNVSLRFVLPLSGVSNAEYFVTLFDSQGLPYVLVVDKSAKSHASNQRVVEIAPKHKFRQGQKEFDIEDLIENELLSKAFAILHPDIEPSEVSNNLGSSGMKSANILKDFVTSRKIKEGLDKVELAKQVVKLGKENPKQYQKTLENFEDLFIRIEQKFMST